MQAIVYRRYGGPEVLEATVLDQPAPGPDELLVKVAASSVNPIDWKLASGKLRLLMSVTMPNVPGFDVAGVVAALGPGVTGFAVGERVHARLHPGRGGASAEFAVVPTRVAAKVPAGMDLGEAAALPLAGMTALQGLRDRAGLPLSGAKDRVLVVGASGGVGHLAVQIARAAGATVTGVCSGRNAALVSRLGAHEVIDYTLPNAFEGKGPFDIVLDCVGGSPSRWTPLLAPGGRFASTMPGPAVFLRAAFNFASSRSVKAVMLEARAEDLVTLDSLVAEGKLQVVVDSRFPLRDLSKAWERSASGRTTGKIVVEVSTE